MGAIEALLLQARLAWDGSDAEAGMDRAGDSAEKMESRMGKTLKKVAAGLAAAFTVDKIIDFGKQCIASGAEVSAETAAFGQIMGDYTEEATKKMGAVAEAAGMVDSRLTPYMTSMTAKFKGLGFDIDDATTMAARGLTLATDASAFWDMSLDESMGHLNSFINGSYEGGEAIGLFANDTQMAAYAVQKGIVKSTKDWANLDEATKQATRLEYAENMMKQSGATGQAAKESGAYANVMANLSEKWRQFQAQIGEPIIEHVVTPAINMLSKGIDYLSRAVDYVKNHFSEWKPYIEGAAYALGVLGAAVAGFKVGSMVSGIVKFAQGLNLAKIKTVAMTVAQKALNLVMSINPIGLVVAAIAALVAAFVVAYNKSETFRNIVNKLWASIKNFLQPAFEAVSNFIHSTVVPAFHAIVDAVKALLVQLEPVLQAIKVAFETAFNNIKIVLSTIWGNIKIVVSTAVQVIKTVITTAFNNIKIVVTTIWNNIKIVISTVLSVIEGIIRAVTAIIKGDWSGAWEAIKGVFVSIWDGIKSYFGNTLNGIKDFLSNTLNGIQSVFSSVWDGIKKYVSNTLDGIKNIINNTMNGIKKAWTSIWDGIKNAATEKIEGARDKIKGVIDKIKGFFDFKFKWPDIPTPHFGITPKGWKIGDLLEGSIPKLSIDWYARAMDKATVLDGATIFGASNGQLLGGGEKGREVVSGEEHLIGLINQAVAQNNAALLGVLREILDIIREVSEDLYDTIVDALTDGVRFKLNEREFGRLVRAHA